MGALVALVAAAFAIRTLRAADTDQDTEPAPPRVLVCATEMAEACTDLADATVEVRVEPPGTTAARLRGGGTLGGDAWLVPRPWIELVQDDARAAGRPVPFGTPSDTLARSALVVIVRSDRRATLEAVCADRIDWACLAVRAGAPWGGLGGSDAWGTVRVAIDDPARTTSGLVALAQMARTFAHRDEIDERDLETAVPAIDAVAAALGRPTDRTAIDTMLEQADSFDLVLTLEADTRVAIASPKASGQLELVEVQPETAADAVLVTAAHLATPFALDLERVRKALTENGWHFADKTAAGVPSAATLRALVARWTATVPRTG